MKQVYLSLLLAGLTAAPALGQKTTVNAKGAGAIATSNPIMAGAALKTPVSLAFDTQADADRWSTNKMNNSIYFSYAGDGATTTSA